MTSFARALLDDSMELEIASQRSRKSWITTRGRGRGFMSEIKFVIHHELRRRNTTNFLQRCGGFPNPHLTCPHVELQQKFSHSKRRPVPGSETFYCTWLLPNFDQKYFVFHTNSCWVVDSLTDRFVPQERQDAARAGGCARRADPVHRGAAAEAVEGHRGAHALQEDEGCTRHIQLMEVGTAWPCHTCGAGTRVT